MQCALDSLSLRRLISSPSDSACCKSPSFSRGFTDSNGVLHDGYDFAVGDIGTVKIGRDLVYSAGADSGAIHSAAAITGSVRITGSLRAATISSTGNMGAVKIGQDLRTDSIIDAGGKLASVTIGGNSAGGIISSGDIGLVTIGKDLDGEIDSGGALAGVTVGGSMLNSASTQSTSQMGAVKIARDMLYGPTIDSAAGISSVTVGGSIVSPFPVASFFFGCAITGAGEIGKVKVGRDATLREFKTSAGGIGSSASKTKIGLASWIFKRSRGSWATGFPEYGGRWRRLPAKANIARHVSRMNWTPLSRSLRRAVCG